MDLSPATDLATLLAWRDRLPIVGRTTHLVNHSLGPMPQAAEDELQQFAAEWARRGVRAWSEGWWESSIETGNLLAPILGVAPGSVAMHPNVSVALNVLLSSLVYPAGWNRIVTTEVDFPSVQYLLHGEQRRGAELVTLPAAPAGGLDFHRLLETIDRRTRAVVVSHVLYRDSTLLDAEMLARRCREMGAMLVLDVYQSAGVVPLELGRWGVDAAVGGSVKWLCGGPGAAYLYVRPELCELLEPTATGWQADEEPFAFRAGTIRRARDARRFLTGTPAVPSLYAARAGLRMIAEVGVATVRERSVELTDLLLRLAMARGFEVRTPLEARERGGTVTVAHPDGERLCAELMAHDVLCDHRPGAGVRFGPHFFNTAEECARAVDLLAGFARS